MHYLQWRVRFLVATLVGIWLDAVNVGAFPGASRGFVSWSSSRLARQSDIVSRRYDQHSYRLILSLSVNPNDLESPEEREARMKLVNQIQKSFYQGDGEEFCVPADDDNNKNNKRGRGSRRILSQVPLWRVQWTELPGYQNVLNVHVAHYTHMFRRVLSGPKPWYFGHVYLPGGSENLDNPKYRLPDSQNNMDGEVTLVGTLMQISDYKAQPDGRLTLIVQAMERFRILEATQHVPYAIATVQREPDEEVILSMLEDNENEEAVKKAVYETLEWNDWEFRPTLWEDVASSNMDGLIATSPLINYNAEYFPNELLATVGATTRTTEQLQMEQKLQKLEYMVWVAVDKMLRLLIEINPGLQIPVPTQLLGLLPILKGEDSKGSTSSWPKGFKLEEYATQLQRNNAIVGTGTKSPFVRVAENPSYPMYLRASRLSYTIWILMESIASLTGQRISKQDILEERSIAKRLEYALSQLDAVNDALREAIQ